MSKRTFINDNSICRACLATEIQIKEIGTDEMHIIEKLSLQDCLSIDSPICVHCWALLNKFNKFHNQCKKLKLLFDDIYDVDLMNEYKLGIKINNLSIDNSVFNISLNDKDDINDINDDYKPELSDNEFIEPKKEEDDLSDYNYDGINDNYDGFNDSEKVDDEINDHDKDKKVEDNVDDNKDNLDLLADIDLKEEKTSIESINIEEPNLFVAELSLKSSSKSDDVFSKRMTKETDQYKVVKLTKDQVRQELKDRLKSEKYLSCRFKCELCARGFNFEDVLENHKRKHVKKKGNLQCEICHQYCAGAVSMRGHIKSHTTRYKCKMCEVTLVSRQQLLEHYSIVHCSEPTRYKCQYCDYSTDKRTIIQRHVKSHNPSKGHKCFCGMICKTIEALRVHKLRHDESKKFSCPHCDRKFPFPKLLKTHIEETHVRKDMYCVECNKYFRSQEGLKGHFKRSRRHVDPSIVLCRLCNHKSKSQAEHLEHKQAKHPSQILPCTKCSKVYKSKDSLRCHMNRAHRLKKERKEQCDLCERSFTQRSSLKRHRLVHTGERPFSCDECPSRFAQASTRDTHVALVHKKVGRKIQVFHNRHGHEQSLLVIMTDHEYR